MMDSAVRRWLVHQQCSPEPLLAAMRCAVGAVVATRQVTIAASDALLTTTTANTTSTAGTKMRTFASFEQWDVGVAFVLPGRIAELNAQYRGKGGPTDVLSFPYHHVSPPCALPDGDDLMMGTYKGGDLTMPDERCGVDTAAADDDAVAATTAAVCETEAEEWESLGDIVVCPQIVLEHAARDATSLIARLPVVLAHGYCHLLG